MDLDQERRPGVSGRACPSPTGMTKVQCSFLRCHCEEGAQRLTWQSQGSCIPRRTALRLPHPLRGFAMTDLVVCTALLALSLRHPWWCGAPSCPLFRGLSAKLTGGCFVVHTASFCRNSDVPEQPPALRATPLNKGDKGAVLADKNPRIRRRQIPPAFTIPSSSSVPVQAVVSSA